MECTCSAVIVAAGNASRMGLPKQFIDFFGLPALAYTLMAFEEAKKIQEIVVVTKEEDQEKVRNIAQAVCKTTKFCCVSGGESRQKSVLAGAKAVSDQVDFVAVHDGARMLITPEEIDGVIADAACYGAAALAIPVKDTIKIADEDGWVHCTPKRSSLWAVQTPQVFPKEPFLCALTEAVKDGRDYTDDCQLWEQMGKPVHLRLGNEENIKLTTKNDLMIARAILQNRREQEGKNDTNR